jgi:hypothetical protein
MKFKILFALLFFGFFVPSLFAETVFFHNGDVKEGRILEKNVSIIKMEIDGVVQQFSAGSVKKILQGGMNDQIVIDPTQFEGVPPEKVELIIRFMQEAGIFETIRESVNSVIESVPQEGRQQIMDLFVVEDFVKKYIPVYHQYFTEQDLKDFIAFFESPSGKIYIEMMPYVLSATTRETLNYIRERIVAEGRMTSEP